MKLAPTKYEKINFKNVYKTLNRNILFKITKKDDSIEVRREKDNKKIGCIQKEKYKKFYESFLDIRNDMHGTFAMSYIMSIVFGNYEKK